MGIFPVIHLVSMPPNGHMLHGDWTKAHDCWCEPSRLFWMKNVHGVLVLVVEHNDHVVEECANPETLEWIDHALYDTYRYPAAPDRDLPKGPDQCP